MGAPPGHGPGPTKGTPVDGGPRVAKKSAEERWRGILTEHHRSPLSRLPHAPRCAMCGVPFEGIGGALARAVGYRRWKKNPTLCNQCVTHLPDGGLEVDVAIMFADLRGSTSLGEQMEPTAFADLLNRFYRVAIDVLSPHRAIIDKMIGDEVMAFFVSLGSEQYRASAVAAATELMRRFSEVLPEEETPRLGIGLHAGLAYVGKVGEGEVSDFTALGDTINAAARLQAEAKAGEIIMSEQLYESVAAAYPDLERRVLQLRGREEPMAVRILDAGAAFVPGGIGADA